MRDIISKAQCITVQFDDGFELSIMLDSVIGVEHPNEENFVSLHVPVFTNKGSGYMVVSTRQMEAFLKSGLMREAHRWLTKKQ